MLYKPLVWGCINNLDRKLLYKLYQHNAIVHIYGAHNQRVVIVYLNYTNIRNKNNKCGCLFIYLFLQVLESISNQVVTLLDSIHDINMEFSANIVKKQLNYLIDFIDNSLHDQTIIYSAARDIAFSLTHIYIGMLQLWCNIYNYIQRVKKNSTTIIYCMYFNTF